jgi:outer membrane biosynthesis protein TonB
VRFNEIANPEDQLALWKLVSDTMWGAFAQELSPSPVTLTQPKSVGQGGAAIPIQPVAKQVPKAPAQAARKTQPKAPAQAARKTQPKAKGRAIKPKRTPTAPAPKPLPKPKPVPKPLPKPNPQQLPPTQAAKQQTQQHQPLPQHLHKEMNKSGSQQRIYPQPSTPIQKTGTPIEPMTNGYDQRDKDELVTHARAQHPFKTAGQIKSALPGQKRGF